MTRGLAVACLGLLAGCATDAQHGRARMVAPSEIGAAYSEVEMQARLALTPDVRCEAHACASIEDFRTRVRRIGERMTDAAYQLAFELDLQTPVSFNVGIPGKDDIGTLSSATGNIIVFDGLRALEPADAVLAFLIAREMGHVLARHHDENSATSIGVSIAVAVLFPVTNVLRGVEAAYATATAASLASTAVSMAGSHIVRGMYKSEQQREADVLALRILAYTAWTPQEIAAGLAALLPRLEEVGWMAELLESKRWLDPIAMGPPLPPPETPGASVGQEAEGPPDTAAEAPEGVVMAAADFVRPDDGVVPAQTLLAGLSHAAWIGERTCRAILPAGVALPGSLLPAGGSKQALPSPRGERKAFVACAKIGPRAKRAEGRCIKPAPPKQVKKADRKPVKKVVRRAAGKRR